MTTRIAVATLLVVTLCRLTAIGGEPVDELGAESKNQLFDLEGRLNIHPKFLYKYYISGLGDGQHCALFGEERLKDIQPGSWIHVTGRLGTRFHAGGSEKNLSPFPRTYYIYMDVKSAKVLRGPESKAAKPSGRGPPGATSRVRESGTKARHANEETRRMLDDTHLPNDRASFSLVLAHKIHPGDSLDDVEALLGAGRRISTEESTKASAAVRRWQKDQPEYYADGVKNGDVFVRWPMDDECTLQLQFRNGRLINHVPESYVQKTSEQPR
jgi:hypothetical protein